MYTTTYVASNESTARSLASAFSRDCGGKWITDGVNVVGKMNSGQLFKYMTIYNKGEEVTIKLHESQFRG